MRRMIAPFVFVTVVFVGVYLYVFTRLTAPFVDDNTLGIALGVSLPMVHIIGFTAQVTGRHGAWHDRWSKLSYVLMGFFAYLLVFSVVRDVGLAILGAVRADDGSGIGALYVANIGVLTLASTAVVIGYVNATSTPRFRKIDVPIANLPDALAGFTVAQLTDVHIGPTIKRGFLERVVARVNEAGVDAVAITGDLIDGSVERLGDDVRPLENLRSRHGTFYVTGNHEYYSGAPAWVSFVESLGIHALLNRHVTLSHDGASLVVAGVPDETAAQFVADHACDPTRALCGAPDVPTVLLAHQPRSVRRIHDDTRVDLMLAGHTHGGQFWPWNLVVPLQQPYVQGLVKHAATWVYTSRGTGYWGPPLRLFAPSEISLVRLVPA